VRCKVRRTVYVLVRCVRIFCFRLAATALWLILCALCIFLVLIQLQKFIAAEKWKRHVRHDARCLDVVSSSGPVSHGAVRCRAVLGPSVGPCVIRRLYGVESVREVRSAPPSEKPGYHDQVPATRDAQRAVPQAAACGLSRYRGLLMCPFTASAPHSPFFFVCACLQQAE
jgi:hypothetical protein